MQAPPGLKKNLLRTYESWTPEQINKKGNLSRAHSLFCLAWFHAVCQERRNYIPQVIFFFCYLLKKLPHLLAFTLGSIFHQVYVGSCSEINQTWMLLVPAFIIVSEFIAK